MIFNNKFVGVFLLIYFFLPSFFVFAHGEYAPVSEVVEAEVLEIVDEYEDVIPGTNTKYHNQVIKAELHTGTRKGDIVEINNDYIPLKKGNDFFVIYEKDAGGVDRFYMQDVDRRSSLILLICLFAFGIVLLGGWYGFRALISLALSLFALIYILVPGLLAGWNPLMASLIVASLILFVALFLTHGFNRESLIAFSGTFIAVLFTVFFASWSVSWTSLSGFAADESVYLNFNTDGTLDLIGLLIGGIIIGVLGVLDDVAITQVAIVRELYESGIKRRKDVFVRAMRVGREHVGAVVNTLALAYVGVSLPLILLMYLGETSAGAILNMEIVATEIVRVIVGSFGIVIAVPVVTLLAVRFLSSNIESDVTSDNE